MGQPTRNQGAACRGVDGADVFGARAAAVEVPQAELKQHLMYPPDWGPTEWGPIPYLPSPNVLVSRMEKQWGDLQDYQGMATTAKGKPSRWLASSLEHASRAP